MWCPACRDVDEHGVAAVLLGYHAVVGHLLTDILRVASGLSILFTATTIGTSRLRVVDRLHVCGMTPCPRRHDHPMSVPAHTGTHGVNAS